MQVEAGLVQMRETAYGKVLQCLPYPRELEHEILLSKLKMEFQISEEAHQRILQSFEKGTAQPKRARASATAAQFEADYVPPAPKSRSGTKARPKSAAPGASFGGAAGGGSKAKGGSKASKKRKEPPEAAPAEQRPQQRSRVQREAAGTVEGKGSGQGAAQVDEFVGQTVSRYWPSYGGWYPGLVVEYSAERNAHRIVYEKGSKKESFEWYNIRKRKEKECKVVAGDKKEEGSKPPTSVPKEHVANGYAKFRQNAQKTGPVTSKKGGAKPAAKVAKGRQRPPAAGLPAAGGQLRHQSSSNSLNAAALQRGTADSQHLLQASDSSEVPSEEDAASDSADYA